MDKLQGDLERLASHGRGLSYLISQGSTRQSLLKNQSGVVEQTDRAWEKGRRHIPASGSGDA